MKRKELLFLTVCFSYLLYAQTSDTLTVLPRTYPGWTLLVPGATHFYDGHIGTGLFFAGIEAASITSAIIYDKELKSQNATNTPYYNTPLLIANAVFSVDMCHFVKGSLDYIKYQYPDFQYDDLPFNELMKTPFQPKNFLSPITFSFLGVALLELYFKGKDATYTLHEANEMYIPGGYIHRDPAMVVYGTTSLITSWGAGVGEEYLFRNYFMPILDYRFNQRTGLLVSSGMFGGAHALNYLIVEDPEVDQIMVHVAVTTIAGYFLGRNVQKHNYQIGQAVAAHTWYNFTLMLGSFLVNPEENVFGVDIRFGIP